MARTIWDRWITPSLSVIQAVGVLAAGIGLILTANQLRLSRLSESASIGIQFDDRLSQPDMLRISDAVESIPPAPILSPKGSTSEDQLDEFLGDYDTIYYLHEEGLINNQMLDDLFCVDPEDGIKDPEIIGYLQQDRAQPASALDYIGFDKLASICNALDNSPDAKALWE